MECVLLGRSLKLVLDSTTTNTSNPSAIRSVMSFSAHSRHSTLNWSTRQRRPCHNFLGHRKRIDENLRRSSALPKKKAEEIGRSAKAGERAISFSTFSLLLNKSRL